MVILGPTAIGKTALAAHLANRLNGEVISADSRQVYRGMDIGTGKDYGDYVINGKQIPYHLIDLLEAGEEYNVFQFQRDFYRAYLEILHRKRQPILCGGSGMYLEAAIRPDIMLEVPLNKTLRAELDQLEISSLQDRLRTTNHQLHNTTDLLDKQRIIRAIEIAEFEVKHKKQASPIKAYQLFGLAMERAQLYERIEQRLARRLKEGMIEEVEKLLKTGVSEERLQFYGLEYKYILWYLQQKLSFEQMQEQLAQAIRKFAKRQLTWFRRMERNGQSIHWIDANLSTEQQLQEVLQHFKAQPD